MAMPASFEHVIVADDSWVSGRHAQSAAALKFAGVRDVSILTVARVLSPGGPPNVDFIRHRLDRPFDPRVCQWTGGACPEP
ncbi:hypothetical protein [Cellulomonas sp. Y8]|uniref:hypothetical protein n=1 Tax=Cellulomonas sp. Y8 TaxID=2591145 RepID=UPI003D716B2C